MFKWTMHREFFILPEEIILGNNFSFISMQFVFCDITFKIMMKLKKLSITLRLKVSTNFSSKEKMMS